MKKQQYPLFSGFRSRCKTCPAPLALTSILLLAAPPPRPKPSGSPPPGLISNESNFLLKPISRPGTMLDFLSNEDPGIPLAASGEVEVREGEA